MIVIDLNADLGEGGESDGDLLALVGSANVACGGHAGDDESMRRTVDLARAAGVEIGAHPGYEDRENFGRREMELPLEVVRELVARQVGRLAVFSGGKLHHVKPHGALYNQACRDQGLAAAVVDGVRRVFPEVDGMIVYALPGSALAAAAQAAGMTVWGEGFADRRYRADGVSLVPRGEPGAVIESIEEAVAQAHRLAIGGGVDTICVHGDGTQAVAMLRAIREAGIGFTKR